MSGTEPGYAATLGRRSAREDPSHRYRPLCSYALIHYVPMDSSLCPYGLIRYFLRIYTLSRYGLMRYLATDSNAMYGTDIAYGAMRCADVARYAIAIPDASTVPVRSICCYAVSGTDVAYAATRFRHKGSELGELKLLISSATMDAQVRYRPTQCPVCAAIGLRARYAVTGRRIADATALSAYARAVRSALLR
eukprot:3066280-Rhodomonas_salina.1